VDTWLGDAHANYYKESVYLDLHNYHRRYEAFSALLRMTFDQALQHIPNASVDLLHIDGLHFYDAVKTDYETWLPKLSDRAVVLFHDTIETQRDFGVHQLWAELSPNFPSFNFEHGHGLGILAVGRNSRRLSSIFFAPQTPSPPLPAPLCRIRTQGPPRNGKTLAQPEIAVQRALTVLKSKSLLR